MNRSDARLIGRMYLVAWCDARRLPNFRKTYPMNWATVEQEMLKSPPEIDQVSASGLVVLIMLLKNSGSSTFCRTAVWGRNMHAGPVHVGVANLLCTWGARARVGCTSAFQAPIQCYSLT